MVALSIRAADHFGSAEIAGVRLLGPFAAALGSLLLHDTADRLFPGRHAGLTAAVLLNATLAMGVGAVVMTPDTPLLLFWTATLWAAARVASGGPAGWWLAAGAFAGFAALSKYTAAFLPIGLGLYVLIASPGWLRRREPWLGMGVAGVIFLPVVIWNAQNDWVGLLRQGGRVADWRPARAVGFIAELIGGQLGLATPGVAVLFVAGIVLAVTMAARTRDPAWSLLAALSVPPAAVFLEHALGDRVQGNWPAIDYPAAAVAASGLTGPVWRRLVPPSAVLGFAIAGLLYVHVTTGWPVLPAGRDPVARQLFGWNGLAAAAEAARQAAGASFIAAEPYEIAAELAWSLSAGTDVIGIGPRWGPTTLPRAATGDRPGILIRPERYGDAPDAVEWRDATRLPDIVRAGGGVELERYAVFLVRAANGISRDGTSALDGTATGALLPRR